MLGLTFDPNLPLHKFLPLNYKAVESFFRAGRKGVVFTMGCVHKHHASFLRLSVCDRNSFIMCTCFCQTENAWYFLSNMYLRPFKCIDSLKIFKIYLSMLIIAPSAGELSYLSFSLTHWLPVGRFGGQFIFSLEGTTAFIVSHIFDFPLSPQNLQIFFPPQLSLSLPTLIALYSNAWLRPQMLKFLFPNCTKLCRDQHVMMIFITLYE